jgi:general secretion pathway protein M
MALPPRSAALDSARAQLAARWRALAPRERRALSVAGIGIALLLVWWIAVQPALRTLREAPAQIDRLDAQLQQMQRMAVESRELRSAPTVSAEQSAAALKAATDRLGDRARLTVQGDRATLTLSGIDGGRLRAWLAEARSGARARTIDAQLTRGAQGYQGTLVVALGGGSR